MYILNRRELLRSAAIAATPSTAHAAGALPTVRFGAHTISRLIVGGNPVSANSHVSPQLDGEMRDYFTTANVKKLLADCERAGINTWQSRGDHHIMRTLNEYRLEGGRIQWIAQTASEYGDLQRNLREICTLNPIGIYHHGSQTDKLWQTSKLDQLCDNLKAIRQTGALVGLGTHIPEVVDHAESKNWHIDFYMTCVYHLTRSVEEAARLTGRAVQGEFFRDADREEMLARVSRTPKTCLIFKVYGATRLCTTADSRRNAIKLAFRAAKPRDAVVIGMFPKHQEQVLENCRLVSEASARPAT